MAAYQSKYGVQSIILFALDVDGKLRVRTGQSEFEAGPGDRLIAIVHAQDSSQPAAGEITSPGVE